MSTKFSRIAANRHGTLATLGEGNEAEDQQAKMSLEFATNSQSIDGSKQSRRFHAREASMGELQVSHACRKICVEVD